MERAPAAATPGLYGPVASESMMRWFVAGWFFFLALYQTSCLVILAQNLDFAATTVGAAIGDIASRFCSLLFYFMTAWITVVRSRPLAQARGVIPRVATALGVVLLYGVFFLPRLEAPPTWLLFLSAGLALLGSALSVYVLHWLGESFSLVPQARRLVQNGPYGLVRHPLYLTEEIAIIGIFLPFWSPATIALLAVHFAMQLLRMNYEEGILRQTFPDYAAYAQRTARLLPGVW